MPKRTNPFQDLVSLIERSLIDKQFIVTDSKFLKCSTGANVEADLTIESGSGKDYRCVSVEATNLTRKGKASPATVEWVNEMFGKHHTLPTTSLVLVSGSGFTRGASEKAQTLGIKAITLSEAITLDWLPIPHKIPHINIESFMIPQLKSVTLVFDDRVKSEVPSNGFELLIIRDQTGKEYGNAIDILNRDILTNKKFIDTVREKSFTDSGTAIEVEYPLKKGMYILNHEGKAIPIHAIRAIATCKREVSTMQLKKLAYGDNVGVIQGTGESFKHPMSIVFTQKKEETVKGILRVSKLKPKK
jgi:hypothetical protein